MRDETVAADVRLLDGALNGSIARWLTEWNFPGAAIPRIRRDVEPADDLDARAEREERIANTSGLRPTKAHVEKVYGGEWEPAPGRGESLPEPFAAMDDSRLVETLHRMGFTAALSGEAGHDDDA